MQTIEKQLKNFPTKEEIEKLPKDGGDRWNRLIFEQSPYLLQHAANPVDWYSWSDEAFEKAKEEDKVVMLSIGYATCHWCHVMEHECFEDQEVADVLNKYFVCIKVDREERPDIDNFYMTLAQILIGRGGWPLNVFLTPERKVFYAATYVPKFSRQFSNGVSLGLIDLSHRINEYWKNQKDKALASAADLLDVLTERKTETSLEFEINDLSLRDIYDTAFAMLDKKFDSEFGGFGSAPKFPSPHIFSFLYRYYKKSNNKDALMMLEKTLKSMRLGGIYDQLGGGFHRYSTDIKWLLPHFEKMLYDQAMLLIAYSELYELTQDQFYKSVIEEIFEYLSRDMKHSSGAFFSAEDADSEGEEGKFYIWSTKELKQLLREEEFELIKNKFALEEQGNFLDEATHQRTGENILHLQDAEFINNSEFAVIKSKLLAARDRRIRPLLDDKILTDWNSLLAVAFVKALKATGDLKFLDSAREILSFILENLFSHHEESGNDTFRVYKSYRQNRSSIQGCLNDYAFLAWALIEIYEVTIENDFLDKAIAITDAMINAFWSEGDNAFSINSKQSTEIPIQNFEFYDGAIPSGNSIAFTVLMRLFKSTQNFSYKNYADKLLQSFMREVSRYPIGYAQFLCGLEYLFSDYQEQRFVCTEEGCKLV